MANYWWICQRCNTHTQKSTTPNNASCPAGGGHRWNRAAEVGDHAFQCTKCQQLIHAKMTPSTGGCASGGGHAWQRL
jgi:hypothetical protein